MITSSRLLYAAIAIVAVPLAVAAGVFLSAPLWIDANAVKQKVAALVYEATGDVVQVHRLRMDLFPPVGVEIVQPRYVAEGLADIAARSAVVEVDFWPLLAGRVRPRLIRLSGVSAVVHVPSPASGAKPFSRSEAEKALRDGISRLEALAPGMEAVIGDATVTIRSSGRSDLSLTSLQGRLRIASGGATLNIECASSFWDRLSIDLSIAGRDLAGRGRAEFVGLDLAGITQWAGASPGFSLTEGRTIGKLDWKMQGLSRIQAGLVASMPRLVVQANGIPQTLTGLAAAASLETRGDAMTLRIERLYAQAPRLLASGTLERDENARLAFSAEGSDVALSDVQAVAANFAPEARWVTRPPAILRAGTVAAFEIHGSADELSRLFDPSAIWGEVTIAGLAADIARPALRLTEAGGVFAFDRGRLDARGITASVGQSMLSNGRLVATYAEDPAILHAQGTVALDLAEAADLAKKLIARKDIGAHLDALQEIDGKAFGRFELDNRRGSLEAKLQVSRLALFVRHQYVPLPLRLAEGRLRYERGSLVLEGVTGEFGTSAFERLDASLQLAPPYAFELRLPKGELALDQLHSALRHVPAAAPALSEIRTLAGSASLSDLQAQGTLELPGASQFQASLVPHAAKALVSRLASDVLLEGGRIDVTDQAIAIEAVDVETLDSKLQLTARLPNYRAGLPSVEVDVGGMVGANTLARIGKESGLPAQYMIRAPLRLGDVHATWTRKGNASVRGNVNVAGGTDIVIDARKAGDALFLDRVKIRDGSSDADIRARLTDRTLDLAFQGRLSGSTITNVLAAPPWEIKVLEGDLVTTAHFGKPWISNSRGRLSGAGIALRLPSGTPVAIERFALDADAGTITFKEALVAVGDNRAEFRGAVRRENEKLALDMDVRSSRIVLPKSMTEPAPRQDGAPFELSDLPFTGRIGLDIGQLETDRLTLVPLVAEAKIAEDGIDVRFIRAALCDITMSGTLKGPLDDLQLAGSLSARGAGLEKSISCLTGGRIASSGTFDLDAGFTSRGPYDALADRVEGRFSALARDGHIEQFDTLNRIFAFLNVTEVVRGQKLGMDQRGLPYRTAKVEGTLSSHTVGVEEAVLDAPTVHIAASGRIDYGANDLSMDVLVAPLQTANVIMDKIPLVNRIFGGAVLALPVQVLGSPRDPIVVPLGPGAVTKRMTSIIANTLKLPLDAVKAITVPGVSGPDAPR